MMRANFSLGLGQCPGEKGWLFPARPLQALLTVAHHVRITGKLLSVPLGAGELTQSSVHYVIRFG